MIGVRLIVDGMNVIGSRPDGWWRDRHAAMVRLVDRLERWAAAQDADITVVFERPQSPSIASASISVAHAPVGGANSADDEIVRLVSADERPHDICVVTSDTTLSARARKAGATVLAANTFRSLIDPR